MEEVPRDDNRTGSQEDLVFGNLGRSHWTDWRSWTRRQKMCGVFFALLSAVVILSLVLVIATYGFSGGVKPAPIPPITTTTSTTTTTPSTTSTTPTTTSTTTTTTTSTTSTTPTTTTTTSTSTTSTTPTTTTTTTSTTPTPNTTTTTGPTTTTTVSPLNPVTTKPIPADPYGRSPFNLLNEVGLQPQYVSVECRQERPPTFREGILITTPHIAENHTWFAESDTIKHARTLAARQAVGDLFSLRGYPPDIHPPQFPCKPVNYTLAF